MIARRNAATTRLDSHKPDRLVGKKRGEDPGGVGATTDAGNHQVRQMARGLLELSQRLATDNGLEIAHHHRQMNLFLSRLNEPQRRWYVGLLSQQPGSPSDRQLTKITGLDEKTIRRGRQELEGELFDVPHERQRREGGGRPRAEKKTLS